MWSVLTGRRKVTADDLRRVRRRWLRRLPRRWLAHLPRRVAVPALTDLGWPRPGTCDLRTVDVPEPYQLEAYWVRVGEDEGPAASLFHRRDEILRLDCLRDAPHLHYGMAESRHRAPLEPRVYFPPGSMDEQITRAVHELGHNVAYCTGLHRRRSVRRATVDEGAFRDAAEELGRQLRDLVAAHAWFDGSDVQPNANDATMASKSGA